MVVDGDAYLKGSVEGADVVHEGSDFDFGEVGFEAGDAGLDPSPSLGDFGLSERCALLAELRERGDDLVLAAELLGSGGDPFGKVGVVGVGMGRVDGALVDVSRARPWGRRNRCSCLYLGVKLLVSVEDLVGDRDGGVVPVGGVGSCPFRFVSGEADDEGSGVVRVHGQDSENQVVRLSRVSYSGFGHVGEVLGGLDDSGRGRVGRFVRTR